jgi:hypothetical protein
MFTAGEPLARVEAGTPQSSVRRHLVRRQFEVDGVVLDQVPGERRELVFHLVDEPLRPVQRERSIPAEAGPQQAVETHEVVHVGVRHEHVAGAQQLARRDRRDVAQVEEQGAALEQDVDEQRRVAERPVDQARLEDRAHACSVA